VKITKGKLRQLIREEILRLNEGFGFDAGEEFKVDGNTFLFRKNGTVDFTPKGADKPSRFKAEVLGKSIVKLRKGDVQTSPKLGWMDQGLANRWSKKKLGWNTAREMVDAFNAANKEGSYKKSIMGYGGSIEKIS
jgi:hypothetical protein